MKKILCIMLFIIILVLPCFSYAQVGDVAGQYYWTDIATFLNGCEIDSINIGGQTLISAEDMHYYSFNVWWFPNERVLDVYSTAHAVNGAPPKIVDFNNTGFKIGDVRGNYYETDIVTQLDGKEITSYNVGGRTYIHAEQMADFGYVVKWNEQERKLFVTSPDRAGYVYDIPMTTDKQKTEEGTGSFSIVYSDGKTVATGDADYFISNLSLLRDGSYRFDMKFYQNGGLYYSTELQNKLNPLVSSGYGVDEPIDPAEKYSLINDIVKISVNGNDAKKIRVDCGKGNGHHDYTFVLTDLPRYRKDEIKEFKVSVGDASGESYEIEITDYSYNLQQ